MEQGDGERPVHQQCDLTGQRQPALDACGLEHLLQPTLNPLLVSCTYRHGRVSGHVRKLRRGAEEPAPLPLRMPGGLREIVEDAVDLLRQPSLGAGEPPLEQGEVRLVAAMKVGGNQIVLIPAASVFDS